MEGPGILKTGPGVWVFCGNTDLLESQTPSCSPLSSQAAVTSYCPLLENKVAGPQLTIRKNPGTEGTRAEVQSQEFHCSTYIGGLIRRDMGMEIN